MTYPITPNPAIHQQPKDIGAQQMLFTSGQLQRWAQNLPLAMTLQLMDVMLQALGVSPDEITALNNDATQFYNSVQTWLAQARTNAENAWNNWVTTLETLEQASAADFAAWLQNAEQNSAAAWTEIQDFLQTGDWSDLSAAWIDIVQAIFGTSSTTGIFGSVPSTSVVDVTQSLQPFGNFPNAAAVAGGGGWSYDGTVGYGTSGGSAEYVCSGALGALRGTVSAVQSGQVVKPSAQLQWSGVVAASGTSPFQLQIIPWSSRTLPGGQLVPDTAGTPVTVAEVTSPAASASWTPLAGTYPVPAGVAFVQMRLLVTADATAGTVWWSACSDSVTGGFLSILKDDLTDLQNDAVQAANAWKTFWATIQTAIQSDAGNIPKFLTDAQTAWNTLSATLKSLEGAEIATLQQMVNSFLGLDPSSGLFPATQVQGVGGFQTIEDTFDTWVSQLGAALGGDVADAGGLAWLAQLMNDIGINSTSPLAPLSSSAQTSAQILATVNNRPASAGLEATVEANGDYHQAATLSSQLVAKTTSRGTCVTISQAKTLGFVQWLGNYSTAPTGFVINFYKMDASGNLTKLFTSTDLSATVSSGVAWYLWDLSTPIDVVAGDVIGVEFQIKTSGSINAYGYTAPVTSSHPTAAIKQLGFTQNWNGSTASTISSASIGWSQYGPYVGLGVGTPPPTPFFPQTKSFGTATTYTIQSWSNFVDLIALGGGGGGEGETGAGNGDGGVGGAWATKTLIVGTDIAAGGTITVTTIGHGGSGGPYFTPGTSGTATVFTWTNPTLGTQTLTAAGGAGGQPTTNLTSWGLAPSPNPETYQGNSYFGGNTNVVGGVGKYPGGGGTGGAAFQYGFAGANGQAWIVDRQT